MRSRKEHKALFLGEFDSKGELRRRNFMLTDMRKLCAFSFAWLSGVQQSALKRVGGLWGRALSDRLSVLVTKGVIRYRAGTRFPKATMENQMIAKT